MLSTVTSNSRLRKYKTIICIWSLQIYISRVSLQKLIDPLWKCIRVESHHEKLLEKHIIGMKVLIILTSTTNVLYFCISKSYFNDSLFFIRIITMIY